MLTAMPGHIISSQLLSLRSFAAVPPTAPRPRRVCHCHAQTAATAKKVVIVGAGVGGICLSGRLARAGYDVTVLEKNNQLGGRAQSVTWADFRFDTGPSLLLFPDVYRQAFEALGARLEDHVQIHQVAPAPYRVFFEDGDHLDLLANETDMQRQLEAVETGAGAQYAKFLTQARGALRMGLPNFIEQDFARWSDVAKLPSMLPSLLASLRDISLPQILGSQDSMLTRYFKDWRIRGLFSFQNLYVGLSPSTAPGVFSLLAGTELTDGVWYPVGGFGKVVAGLVAASEACGACFRYGAEVTCINDSDGSVTGVTLSSGEILKADIVVSNRDVPATYPLLSSKAYGSKQHQRLSAKSFSAGVISFCWCVDRRLDVLLHHNVFLSGHCAAIYKGTSMDLEVDCAGKGEAAWQRAGTADQLLSWPNFYVHVPNRTDPSAAPANGDSIMVLLPVANLQQAAEGDFESLVHAGRQAVLETLQKAGVGNLQPHILHEQVRTPVDWRDEYGLEHGAAFGLSHGLDQLAVMRPSLTDGRIKGLYFVGAGTRPGNGVPLVLISARLAAERIVADGQQGRV